LARRCTSSALCLGLGLGLGLGLLVLSCHVLLSLLAFLRVFELLVLEVLVPPRGRFVGVAAVSSAGRRLLKGLSGLSFCGRVETNFDAFVVLGCEESVNAVSVAVGCLRDKEAGESEALGDSLRSREDLLALEAANASKS
jgi:hypothetical protein